MRDHLGVIAARLVALVTPLHRARDLIGAVKQPLSLPPTIIRRLDDATTILKTLRLVATGLSWVPGPIGAGASAAARAIGPFVAAPPPPRGILGNARAVVAEIETMVKPARIALEKLEKLLGKVTGALDTAHARILALIALADALLAKYGASPPPGIEACCARLNITLAAFLDQLAGIEQALAAALERLRGVLATLQGALAPLTRVAEQLDALLRAFAAKPFQAVLQVMRKLVETLEPWRRRAEWLLRKVLGGILKALGINLAAIERFFDGIINALNPLKPIEKALADLKAKLKAQLEALLRALGVTDLLDTLEALTGRLLGELDAFLKSACARDLALAAAAATAATRATASPRTRSARR